jgi:hypothetical protein
MPRVIEVVVSPTGEATVQTKDYAGADCLRASKFLEERVLDAAAGLTRYEAEGAFALSLTRHNAIRPEAVWELKAQALKKNNLLTLHRGGERFDALGGLANLKDFCRRALRPGRPVLPRGVLLLGVPGVGKSAFAKALGNETGRPTLLLDVGSLYGSLVGATEANVRQALRVAEAMSWSCLHPRPTPCGCRRTSSPAGCGTPGRAPGSAPASATSRPTGPATSSARRSRPPASCVGRPRRRAW